MIIKNLTEQEVVVPLTKPIDGISSIILGRFQCSPDLDINLKQEKILQSYLRRKVIEIQGQTTKETKETKETIETKKNNWNKEKDEDDSKEIKEEAVVSGINNKYISDDEIIREEKEKSFKNDFSKKYNQGLHHKKK